MEEYVYMQEVARGKAKYALFLGPDTAKSF